MLKNPYEEIWAQAFHLDWSSFEVKKNDINYFHFELRVLQSHLTPTFKSLFLP